MSNSLKARIYARVITYRDGSEKVDYVSHEPFNPFDIASEGADKTTKLDGVRVVEFDVDVPAYSQTASNKAEAWQQDRYRVAVIAEDGYEEAAGLRMSLVEAARLACSFDTNSRAEVVIYPPTHESCQPEAGDGDDDDDGAEAAEQAEEAEAELIGA